MNHLRTLLALTSLVLGGCVGAPSSFDGARSGLAEIDSGTEALPSLSEEEWQEAPAGCEDRLGVAERLTFALASLHDHLVAAVDSSGDIVCVDTIESVQEELEEQGDEERADSLGDSFLVALTIAAMPDADRLRAADPTPQPNTEISAMTAGPGAREGDPTPQPNSQPIR